jgi:flagellar protein FlbD
MIHGLFRESVEIMIHVTRLNGKEFVINCDMIKFVESTPDTVITLADGDKLMVRESVDVVVERTMEYRKRVLRDPPAQPPSEEQTEGKSKWT